MADRFRVGSGAWNTTASWSTTTGGSSGASIPGASDKAIFDGNGITTMVIDLAFTIAELSILAGYTGTFDNATNNHNLAITGPCILAGTRVDMGNGAWTLSGNVDMSGVTTLNKNASTIILSGAGSGTQTIDFGTHSVGAITVNDSGSIKQLQNNLTCAGFTGTLGEFIDNAKVVTVIGNILIANTANILTSTGTWKIDGTSNISNPHSTNRFKGLQVLEAAIISQIGRVYTQEFLIDEFSTFSQGSNTMNVNASFISGADITFSGETGKVIFDATTGTPIISSENGINFNDIEINNVGVTTFLLTSTISMNVNGNFTLIAGKFDMNDKNLDVGGSITTIAGEFKAGTGTLFVGGSISFAASTFTAETSTLQHDGTSGTPTIATNANSIHNFTIDNSGVDSFLSDNNTAGLTMTGNFLIVAGEFTGNGHQMKCGGNWDDTAGTFVQGGSGSNDTLVFEGGANAGTLTTDATLVGLEISGGVAFALSLGSNVTVTGTTSVGIAGSGASSLNFVSFTLTVRSFFVEDTSSIIAGTGTLAFTSSSASSWLPGPTQIYNIINFIGTGAVVLSDSGSGGADAESFTCGNLTIGTGASFEPSSPNTDFITITCTGNLNIESGTFVAGTGTVIMSGTSKTLLATNAAPNRFWDVQISGTLTITKFMDVLGDLDITATGTMTLTGGWTVTLSVTTVFTLHATGTVNGAGGIFRVSINDSSTMFPTTGMIDDITIQYITSGTGGTAPIRSRTYGRDMIIGGSGAIQDEKVIFSAGTMTLDRGITMSPGGAATVITADAITNNPVFVLGWGLEIGHLTLQDRHTVWNHGSGAITCGRDVIIKSSDGVFDNNTINMGSGAWSCARNWINLDTINGETSTLTMNSATGSNIFTAGTGSYFGFTVNNSSTALALQDNIDINGDVNLTAGLFDLNGNDLNFAADWTEGGAFTFTPGTGKVTCDGAGPTIFSGTTTFFDLSCTTPGKSLTFDSTGDILVTNEFILDGVLGNLITMVSDNPGTQWGLNVSGSHCVNFVNVRDSDASAGNLITALNSVGPGQNNTNWSFGVGTIGVQAPTMLGFRNRFVGFNVKKGGW